MYTHVCIVLVVKLFVQFQNVGTVTLEIPDGISRTSLDNFVCQILWENVLEDGNGNTAEIIRMKVSEKVLDDEKRTRPESNNGGLFCRVHLSLGFVRKSSRSLYVIRISVIANERNFSFTVPSRRGMNYSPFHNWTDRINLNT